ncbi:MAG: hypothetical protein G3M78_12060 [Candidatus Nitrohelix vancouverensis]|uniref:PpiC domain-containing protein n=1 Tax=Candidatus Nitrohelix vancouverensis TaxID=2705534 RepID=A0A7T0C419_9BACT|nr:MAG: hypothetical protein G3M78_12060 [Candidatus Nitrohelix vancouverensis]
MWNHRSFPGKRFAALLAVLILFSACSDSERPKNQSQNPGSVMTVNGESVSVDEFQKNLNQVRRKFHMENHTDIPPEEKFLLKTQAMNQSLQSALLRQEIRKSNVALSREEWEAEFQKAKNGYNEGAFERYLEDLGVSLEEWKKDLEFNMLTKKLIRQNVNSKVIIEEKELREYFDGHPEEFTQRDKVRALHIMVRTEEECREIQKLLKSRLRKFPDLARERSLSPEGTFGGDLGYFEAGHMPEEFDSVFKLDINEVSDVIHTPYGFHLFKVMDKKDGQKMTFEESREQIQARLLQTHQDEAFSQWLLQLKEDAKIEINDDVFNKIG